MKKKLLLIFLVVFLISCNKKIYGVYNTKHSTDKSSFFEIKLNSDNSFERKEIHTITINSKGSWVKINNEIICYEHQNEQGFPADTLIFKIVGEKLYIVREGIINKSKYLIKN